MGTNQKKIRRVRWKMFFAQLSTIDTTPKFRIWGGGADLQKIFPHISRWGPAQLKMISAELSTTKAQLMPFDSIPKIEMGAGFFPAPLPTILEVGASAIEKSRSTMDDN